MGWTTLTYVAWSRFDHPFLRLSVEKYIMLAEKGLTNPYTCSPQSKYYAQGRFVQSFLRLSLNNNATFEEGLKYPSLCSPAVNMLFSRKGQSTLHYSPPWRKYYASKRVIWPFYWILINMNIMLEEGSENYSRLLFDNFELFKKFYVIFPCFNFIRCIY